MVPVGQVKQQTYQYMTPEWLIAELGPHWYPNRGIGPIPPTDPVIYRLFEASQPTPPFFLSAYALFCLKGVLVYGHAIKVRLLSSTTVAASRLTALNMIAASVFNIRLSSMRK